MSPEAPPLPAGTVVEPAADLRTKSGGRILIGGAPLSIVRLSSAGAAIVRSWFGGTAVGDNPRHVALARRLSGNGMAHLRLGDRPRHRTGHGPEDAMVSEGGPESEPVTVIIPVKDDQQGLDRTLQRLFPRTGRSATEQPRFQVIVVDDGSQEPISIGHQQATLIRHAICSGPGPARQAGLDRAATAVVAFLDAGVLIDPQDLQQLAGTLDDPVVVAAAPRVRSVPADHLVGRYDHRRSPLDLGPAESVVGPGRLVPYVPTACLVARADQIVAAGGFNPDLRYGEDVDLVWRLGDLGTVRYLPAVEAHHPPRASVLDMAGQRRSYGSAAGPLAKLHGAALAPTRVSPWSVLVFALTVIGRPLAALTIAVGTGLALRPKIRPLPDLTIEALLLTMRGHWYGAISILTAITRVWSPLLAIGAMLAPGHRRRLAALGAAAFCRRLLDGPRSPRAAAIDLTMGAIDDLAYCFGVWQGSLKARSATAIKPGLTSWPKQPAASDGATSGRAEDQTY